MHAHALKQLKNMQNIHEGLSVYAERWILHYRCTTNFSFIPLLLYLVSISVNLLKGCEHFSYHVIWPHVACRASCIQIKHFVLHGKQSNFVLTVQKKVKVENEILK